MSVSPLHRVAALLLLTDKMRKVRLMVFHFGKIAAGRIGP